LVERISQAIRHDGTIEPLKGLHLHRWKPQLFGAPPMRDVERLQEAAFGNC